MTAVQVARPGAEPLAAAPAAPPRRPRVLLVGTALASGATVMTLVGMLGAYLSVRADVVATGEPWLPAGTQMPLSPANMGFGTLLMAAVVVQWAVDATKHSDRPHAYLAMGLSIVLGVAHVVMMGFYLSQTGLFVNGAPADVLDQATPALFVLGIVGFHLAMMTAALVFVALMAIRTLGGQFTGRDHEGVTAAALFFHVTVAAYAVVWYAIFITK